MTADVKTRRPVTLDLSVFDTPMSLSGGNAPPNQINVVLDIALDKISEDPNQPRTLFDEAELQALADDIGIRGVQQPITVRPAVNGAHKIIQGARRYRASKLAGKQSIPCLIEADATRFDDFAQVTENLKRENLSALDLAQFIDRKVKAGLKQKDVAEQLGITKTRITELLALLAGPEEIRGAFAVGVIDSVRTAYELIQLHKSKPDIAAQLLATGNQITRSMVDTAVAGAESASQSGATEGGGSTAGKAGPAGGQGGGAEGATSLQQNSESSQSAAAAAESAGGDTHPGAAVTSVPPHNPALDRKNNGGGPQRDPTKIRKPLLLGRVSDRAVKVLLARTPSAVGLIHIQYEDSMEEAEVDIGQVKLTALTEMRTKEVT